MMALLRLGLGWYAALCLTVVASVDALVRMDPALIIDVGDIWRRPEAPVVRFMPASTRGETVLPSSDALFVYSEPSAPAAPPVVEVQLPPPPPPPPRAPVVPYQYLGRMDDESGVRVFLQLGPDVFVVAPEQNVDYSYRLDKVEDERLVLTHLPTGQVQTMSIR